MAKIKISQTAEPNITINSRKNKGLKPLIATRPTLKNGYNVENFDVYETDKTKAFSEALTKQIEITPVSSFGFNKVNYKRLFSKIEKPSYTRFESKTYDYDEVKIQNSLVDELYYGFKQANKFLPRSLISETLINESFKDVEARLLNEMGSITVKDLNDMNDEDNS